jgi:hypothetical protein
MTRNTWESQFTRLLPQKLQLIPEQVRFLLSTCFSQGQTPARTIAYLERVHRLYPELGVLLYSLKIFK